MRLDRTRLAISERTQNELLDLSFLVLRQFVVPIVGLVALLAIPLALLNYFLAQWMAADLTEDSAIVRYLWTISVLVYFEAPFAGILATAYLGKVTFYEEPEPKELLRELVAMSPRVIWTQLILRGVVPVIVLMWLIEPDDTFTGTEVGVIFLFLFVFLWRSARPYINEIVVLERSPIFSKSATQITIGKRSQRLHGPNQGDLIARAILLIPISIILGCAVLGLLWFVVATFTNNWVWDGIMIHIGYPTMLWMMVTYVTVLRFLSYLDLRIRREGWEVELKMRAEGSRLTDRFGMGQTSA